jgi:hypothetical protein
MEQKIKFVLNVEYKDGSKSLQEYSANLYTEIVHFELVNIELVSVQSTEKVVQTLTK